MNQPYPTSQLFRELALNRYPALRDNAPYRHLFARILFATDVQEGGLLPIPAETLARYECKEKQFTSKNYCSKPFIDGFMASVFPLLWKCEDGKREWKHYPNSSQWNECRMLESHDMCDEVVEAFARELRGCFDFSPAVEFVSGKLLTPKTRRNNHEKSRMEMLKRLEEEEIPEVIEIIDYLANLSPAIFAALMAESRDAMEAAIIAEIPDNDPMCEIKRGYVRATIRRMIEAACPYYKTTKGTTRISNNNICLISLPRGVRKAGMPGCYDIDIKQSQLAIAAVLWNLPVTQEYLASGKYLWGDLMGRTGTTGASKKRALKDATYAAVYGASVYQHHNSRYTLRRLAGVNVGRDNSVKGIVEASGIDFREFSTHPVLAEILKCRSRELKRVEEDGGAFDAFGSWIKYAKNTSKEDDVYSAPSILAQVAQSWELKIMHSVIQLAKSSPRSHGFKVILWQHDGVTIKIDRDEETEMWLTRIAECISGRAKELGFNMGVEAERL